VERQGRSMSYTVYKLAKALFVPREELLLKVDDE
jgi:hypothetical protein